MGKPIFHNRDLSWLGFNRRILEEAAKAEVPLLERIKFLAIYSSNLDEFYRVRVPVLMAVHEVQKDTAAVYAGVKEEITLQQEAYGAILRDQILPALESESVYWIYNAALPDFLKARAGALFFNQILAFLQPKKIDDQRHFFAENNSLYQAVVLMNQEKEERIEFVNIPTAYLPRFFKIEEAQKQYIVFIEDIIKLHLDYLYPQDTITGVYHVKVTRDAELRLDEELDADMVLMIEKELANRDSGAATRFLCEPGIPMRHLFKMVYALNLERATVVSGGVYHNLKDLSNFPLQGTKFSYPREERLDSIKIPEGSSLLQQLEKGDMLIHVPYQSYDPVLRFFSEAAHDISVEAIYCTLYRVADPSKIVQALISGAQNGKRVTVMLELKARFDEANNIKWARQMKAAGVVIIYSSIAFKVHAKVALLKRKAGSGLPYLGLLATGNFNEVTAKFYTDHILLTGHQAMLKELDMLFAFLGKKKKKPSTDDFINFKHLLVAQFNLQAELLSLIDREIRHAQSGKAAGITIKLNNLEERVLISKLYEASCAGVKIQLLVRSICCLVPGIAGQSEHITVKRIVGRYLEHGRIFVFNNDGDEEVFMGSADWMNRNIYGRIEVCFPVYDPQLRKELIELLRIQLSEEKDIQEKIYHYLLNKQRNGDHEQTV